MSRPVIARNRSRLAEIVNELDGKREGISRAEARKALKFVEAIETVAKIKGYKSVLMPIIRKANAKAKKFKAMRGKK